MSADTKPAMQTKKVLTVAATFPSLIQPWLVAQLVQIIKNGGENWILARQSETTVFSEEIEKYRLNKCCEIIPESKIALILNFLRNFISFRGIARVLKGATRYRKVLSSSSFSTKEKLFSIALLPYMGMHDIDLVHSHSEMAGDKLLPIVYALGKPLVVTFHGLPPVGVRPITQLQRKRYTDMASVILVNTEFAKNQYSSLGAPADKIRVIPQGLNLENFPYKPARMDDEINLLTVGRFHPDKGQEYAIKAVNNLLKQGYKIKYRLVGGGPDQNKLEILAKDLGIRSEIEFYSGLSDPELRSIYAKSHIFVLPSLKSVDGFHEETQGVVLQEAQATGLIVVATRVGGIPECIDDGVSAFLVNDRSPSDITDMVKKLVSRKSEWREIQLKGRKYVEKNYNIENIGLRIQKLYGELVS